MFSSVSVHWARPAKLFKWVIKWDKSIIRLMLLFSLDSFQKYQLFTGRDLEDSSDCHKMVDSVDK